MKFSKHSTLLAAICVSLALNASASATDLDYININFNSNAVGDNYTAVSGVGTNTNLIGTGTNVLTGATAGSSGSWSATVDSSYRLRLDATAAAGGNGSFLTAFNSQAAPSSAVTWFYQFDYTRLADTSACIGINFLNNSGQNMLGHSNNATLYSDNFTGASSTLAVGSTYTLRLEVDSGTSTVRTYINGVLFNSGLTANVSRTTAFGGIEFNLISGTQKDVAIDNIQAGVVAVPEPATTAMAFLGTGLLLAGRWVARRRR